MNAKPTMNPVGRKTAGAAVAILVAAAALAILATASRSDRAGESRPAAATSAEPSPLAR